MNKKAKLRKIADILWRDIILKKYPQCEICGKLSIQAHHFFGKNSYGHLRYDLNNGIGIDMGCHFAHHHRGDALIHLRIIEKRGSNWIDSLKAQARVRLEGSWKTIKYYEDIIKSLTEELKRYE